jgi:hypothetical protein
MLFRLWGGTDFRSTKDLDLEGFLQDEAELIREVFASICVQPVEDDGLAFDASSVKVTEIRDTQEYGGFRVLLTARLGTAILRLQVDVGFGDAITPAPAITEFPSILSQSRPRIRVYPRETVVAEKFEAMVQLGMTNSRMKDYFDLWFMSRHFEFEGPTLAAAVRATFERRGTLIPGRSPIALTMEYADDPKARATVGCVHRAFQCRSNPELGRRDLRSFRIRFAASDCGGNRAVIQPALEASKSVAAS